jgi:hypothetical protein
VLPEQARVFAGCLVPRTYVDGPDQLKAPELPSPAHCQQLLQDVLPGLRQGTQLLRQCSRHMQLLCQNTGDCSSSSVP